MNDIKADKFITKDNDELVTLYEPTQEESDKLQAEYDEMIKHKESENKEKK